MISVALYSYHRVWQEGADVAELLRLAREAGADGVEPLDVQLGLRGLSPKAARERLLLSMSVFEDGPPVTSWASTAVFGGPQDQRGEADRLRLAKEVMGGRGPVRAFSADGHDGVSRERAFRDAVEGLRLAGGEGLALENHGALFHAPDDLRAFTQAVPGLRLTLDVGNFASKGHDPVATCRTLAPLAANVHLKDFQGGEPCALGEGDVPVAACLDALREKGYAGPLTIELEMPQDAVNLVARSVAYLNGR